MEDDFIPFRPRGGGKKVSICLASFLFTSFGVLHPVTLPLLTSPSLPPKNNREFASRQV